VQQQRREELRAADVDREFVAGVLKGAVDEGRLSLTEFDERLQQVYASRTYGDLDQVLADLPHPVAPEQAALSPYAEGTVEPVAGPADLVERRRAISGWLAGVWTAWLIAVSVNVVIWVIVSVTSQEFIYPWPVWVAGPWGAVLVAITVSGLARGDAFKEPEPSKGKKKGKKRKQTD